MIPALFADLSKVKIICSGIQVILNPFLAMGGLLLVAIVIDGHLILNHEISTWWIPVFVFTLELIIKATTSFAVFYMQKNDFNEGKYHKFLWKINLEN